MELFSNVGGSGDNFSATVLDDAATTSITAGSASFTGTFQPEGSLAALNDLDAAGTWTLEISDNAKGGSGTLNSWSIEIATYLPPAVPGITVEPTSGLETTEAGTTDSFTVVLDSQPTHEVTIGISVSPGGVTEGSLSPSSLSFDTSNWSDPQEVVITGLDDVDPDGDVTYTVILAAAVSSDLAYNGFNPDDVSVTNLDDETPTGGEETHTSADQNLALRDAHPKNGRARTTTSTLEILSTAITSIGTLDLDISIDGGGTGMTDLSATLIGPGTTQTIAVLTTGIYPMSAFGGGPLAGLWTLEITDSVNNSPHVLTGWSLVATPQAAAASQQAAAAAIDQLLAAEADDDDPIAVPSSERLPRPGFN